MTHYFIVPGLGNSGADHWQTHFEKSGTNFQRIEQREWDAPACQDWVANIDAALFSYDLASVILIGHSLGCATIAHWAHQSGKIIKGAMLVAPSDLEAPAYDFPATGFDPMPNKKINFPTMVVASANDVWVSMERARFFAANWGSEFVDIGNAGHINAAAGFGPWPQGLELLKKLG